MPEKPYNHEEDGDEDQVDDESSTAHVTSVEGLRRILVWLVETQVEEPQVPCSTCGHDISDHTGEAYEACRFPSRRSVYRPVLTDRSERTVTWADEVSYPAPDIALCRCRGFVQGLT